jgi:hypothetical protein
MHTASPRPRRPAAGQPELTQTALNRALAVRDNLLLLYLVTLAFLFSSLGVGVLISTVSRTFNRATQLASSSCCPAS